jgi:hypothetical protein
LRENSQEDRISYAWGIHGFKRIGEDKEDIHHIRMSIMCEIVLIEAIKEVLIYQQ